MALPTSRDVTITDGDPIPAALLNKLQDCIVNRSHGEIEIPIDLSQRLVVQGTWTVNSGGVLSESSNTGICHVPVSIPVGSVVKTVRARGIQTGPTDVFNCALAQNSTSGASANIIGSSGASDGATISLQQDATTPVLNHTTVTNNRYFVTLQTSGGGAGARLIVGAYLVVSKP